MLDKLKRNIPQIEIIILLIYPLIIILVNNNWIFTPPNGLADGWIYYAYMRYFYQLAPVFPSNTHYFVERMSWIVPGYYIHQIFSPVTANYIYHLIVYYLAVFSLYGILRSLENHRIAFISAILMGSYSWFLRSTGWDYLDGMGIALLLLLLFLLTLTVQSKHWKWFVFFAGITNTAMLNTNLFWLSFVPGWIAFFLLLNFKAKKFNFKQLFLVGFLFLCGSVFLAAILAIFFHAVTGHYNFLRNSIRWSGIIAKSAENTQGLYSYYGVMPPFWHVLPITLILASIIQLIKFKSGFYTKNFILLLVTFTVMFGWMVLWHIIGLPYLIVFLYSSYLIPSTFLLLGALLSLPGDVSHIHTDKSITIIAPFLLILPFVVTLVYPKIIELEGNITLILICAGVLLISLLSLQKKNFIYLMLASFVALSFIGGINSHVFLADSHYNQNNYLIINDVIQEIENRYPKHNYEDFRLWYANDGQYYTNNALGAFYLFPFGSVIDIYPTENLTWPEHVSTYESDIVLLSRKSPQDAINEANQALIKRNFKLKLISSKTLKEGSFEITIVFSRLVPTSVYVPFGEKYDLSKIEGENWSTWQRTSAGIPFRWSTPQKESNLNITIPQASNDLKFHACAIMALSFDIPPSLKISVNDVNIPITLSQTEDCLYYYSGVIPGNVHYNEGLNISFQVDKVVSALDVGLASDPTKLGLAFSWIRIDK